MFIAPINQLMVIMSIVNSRVNKEKTAHDFVVPIYLLIIENNNFQLTYFFKPYVHVILKYRRSVLKLTSELRWRRKNSIKRKCGKRIFFFFTLVMFIGKKNRINRTRFRKISYIVICALNIILCSCYLGVCTTGTLKRRRRRCRRRRRQRLQRVAVSGLAGREIAVR